MVAASMQPATETLDSKFAEAASSQTVLTAGRRNACQKFGGSCVVTKARLLTPRAVVQNARPEQAFSKDTAAVTTRRGLKDVFYTAAAACHPAWHRTRGRAQLPSPPAVS